MEAAQIFDKLGGMEKSAGGARNVYAGIKRLLFGLPGSTAPALRKADNATGIVGKGLRGAGALGAGAAAGTGAAAYANRSEEQNRAAVQHNYQKALDTAADIRRSDSEDVANAAGSELQAIQRANAAKQQATIWAQLQRLEPWQKALLLSGAGFGAGGLLDLISGKDEDETGYAPWLGLAAPAAYGLYHTFSNPNALTHLRNAGQDAITAAGRYAAGQPAPMSPKLKGQG